MSQRRARPCPAWTVAAATCVLAAAATAGAQELPYYLQDRGTGVSTSILGTYVRGGELLVYPFFEYYDDGNLEYKPSELGYGSSEEDFRGQYNASEGLLFLGYGITRNFAIELEGAYISARFEKDPADPSSTPPVIQESGLGDVETELRWRFLEENEHRPEAFTYFETVFPLQKDRALIGTRDWEFKLGFGVIKGYHWGTITLRAAVQYALEEGKVDAGEWAIEYLKRLSPKWRVVVAVEGQQLDEISLITEIQWHFHESSFLKINNAWGLTPNATNFAPEIGVAIAF
jgi:hypothetical protein